MSDIKELLAAFKNARAELVGKREELVLGLKEIDEELARIDRQAGAEPSEPRTRGKPGRKPKTTNGTNGHAAAAPKDTRGFVEHYLGKNPDSGLEAILEGAAKLHVPLKRKNLHSSLFYMRNKGFIAKKGEGTDARYRLAGRRPA